jgi:hypothetical protein
MNKERRQMAQNFTSQNTAESKQVLRRSAKKKKETEQDIIDGESEIDTSTYAAPKGKIICK